MNRLPHLLALFALTSSVSALEVTVVPDCAGPDVPVGIVVWTRDQAPVLEGSKVTVERTGSAIKVVVQTSEGMNPGPPGTLSTRQLSFGKLPIGIYHVQVYYRTPSTPVTEATLGGSANVSVSVAPVGGAACTPAVIGVVKGAFQDEQWNGEEPPLRHFPEAVEVHVTDAQGRPVSGVPLSIVPWLEPGRAPGPAATFEPPNPVTDAAGVARFNATANDVAGVAQYAIQAARGAYILRTYVVLRNRGDWHPIEPWSTPMVGYWSKERAHYFMTADAPEMAILDAKPPEEWIRNNVFLVYKKSSGLPNRSSGVCRFYGLPEKGLDSHFFAADKRECDKVIAEFSGSWVLETAEAFRAVSSHQSGVPYPCNSPQIPLYRVYNNRPDVNHLYTTSPEVREMYVRLGYIAEGYGEDAVQMCVPK